MMRLPAGWWSAAQMKWEGPVSVPTFVVGTGRCGSTMLSNMLRQHPQVLSLSEFYACLADFGRRIDEAFFLETMDGPRFWSMLAAITPYKQFVYRQRIACDEFLYPFEAPHARYSSETGVPAILTTTLPHLTPDHDRLFDTLRDEVTTWPEARLDAHYQHLFDWLAVHFGKRLWIERSGAALHMLGGVLSTFPDARLLHVARDGRDAVLSMQRHPGMGLFFVMSTLAEYLGVDPIESSDRTNVARVPEEWRPLLPENFNAEAFRAFRVPLSICTTFWSRQVEDGLKLLAAVPAERLLTLRYEDFFVDPKAQLDVISAFLGDDFVDESWSTACAATVRQPRSSWRDLPEETARALTEACRPGLEQLRAAGIEYEV